LILIALTLLLITGKAKKAGFVDSNDLTQTAFVATLDSNLPANKNVIWCATFQMAWDKLKNDIIKEPVKLIDAQDLANQMNRSEFPPENLDADSYYAAAGFVEDGIIEKVKADMAKRFPDEPAPVFNAGYYTLVNPILTYAYLNANIQFKNLFYTYKKPFTFESSNREKTNVTAFSCANERDVNYYKVRDQIIVLYFERGKDINSNYFAVDLCAYTQPYQVILALMPQKNTFQEMISDVENKIASYKNYFRFGPLFNQTDNLIVPDVIANITHDYKEFIKKNIGNEPWKSKRYFIFDAQQTIDFSLGKSGAVIKSQAKGGGGGMMGGASEPRYMYFNRPFLIYSKKRQPDAKPFFVMWIDNAELLKKLKVEAK
jgi:hypothetical protein